MGCTKVVEKRKMKKEKGNEQHFFAKRSLGQNFLIAPKVAERIALLASSGHDVSRRVVLEVGPGKGMLTRELLKRAEKVVAIEKDDRLYELLQTSFSKEIKLGRLQLVHGDAVNLLGLGNWKSELENPNSEFLIPNSYTVAANIPYNLTGELLRLFLSAEPKPASVTVLVQKEVAERVVAKDGKESILSLSVKAYGEPHFEGKVPRTLFRPVPGVDSAILHIANVSNAFFDTLLPRFNLSSKVEGAFFALVRLGFAHKRKFLLSNLADLHDRTKLVAAFENIGIQKTARAENLTLSQWSALFVALL